MPRANLRRRPALQVGHLLARRLQGQRHIRARVAVGDGKTLSALIAAAWRSSQRLAAFMARFRSAPSQALAGGGSLLTVVCQVGHKRSSKTARQPLLRPAA